jgi:putative signal transducing protein
MDDPTILRTFSDRTEAEIVRAMLEAAGIPAMVVADDSGETLPSLDLAAGVQVVVSGADFERAQAVLDEPAAEIEVEDAERDTEG